MTNASMDEKQIEPIDLAGLQNRYGKKSKILLDMFDRDAGDNLQKLKKSIAEGDQQAFLFIVHGMKGICGSIYAHRLHQMCNRWEEAAHRSWDTIEMYVGEIENEFGVVIAFIQRTAPHLGD